MAYLFCCSSRGVSNTPGNPKFPAKVFGEGHQLGVVLNLQLLRVKDGAFYDDDGKLTDFPFGLGYTFRRYSKPDMETDKRRECSLEYIGPPRRS